MIFAGHADGKEKHRQELIWAAYSAEQLSRYKKLPPLASILRRMVKPKRKTWQEQMAVMGQWAAVMKTIEERKKK